MPTTTTPTVRAAVKKASTTLKSIYYLSYPPPAGVARFSGPGVDLLFCAFPSSPSAPSKGGHLVVRRLLLITHHCISFLWPLASDFCSCFLPPRFPSSPWPPPKGDTWRYGSYHLSLITVFLSFGLWPLSPSPGFACPPLAGVARRAGGGPVVLFFPILPLRPLQRGTLLAVRRLSLITRHCISFLWPLASDSISRLCLSPAGGGGPIHRAGGGCFPLSVLTF